MARPKPKSKTDPAPAAAAAPEEPAKPEFPAYTVETWPIGKLKPYDRNPRTHSKEQIEQLRGSFKKFGQVWPILVRAEGTIIAGHGRLEAAKLEGYAEVKVIVAAGWTDEQCRAFGLLDNRVAMNSAWDEEALGLELADLSNLGVPLGELGFDEAEIGELLAGSEDETPPTERKGQGDLNPVIQFNIVFDDERQQELWFGFVRLLKTAYPDEETLGARLTKHLEAQGTHAAA